MKLTTSEIASMISDARRLHLHQLNIKRPVINITATEIKLALDQGVDGKWITANDTIKLSFRLANRGGRQHFRFGICGPIPDLATLVDVVNFETNFHWSVIRI